jgi:hypothetical protein
MNQCVTCKHWKPEKEKEWGACILTANDSYEKHEGSRGPGLAYATDTDGNFAILVTRQDFGCVSWSAEEGT